MTPLAGALISGILVSRTLVCGTLVGSGGEVREERKSSVSG
jgi:hypothetical protein